MTANRNSQTVRWLVIIVLATATAVMAGVSMRANYLFGYGFGQTPEKANVFGWANVAADLWKVSGLIVITSLWRARQKRFAFSLGLIWALCLAWGLAGAVGVYAQDRTTLIGEREAKTATYKDVEHEVAEIDAKLEGLRTQRTVAQVDAAMGAVLARPVMSGERVRGTVAKLSVNCTKEDRATAEACLEVAGLREERAASEERFRLENRKAILRTQITKLREGGGSLVADPVAEVFAWLSRGQLSVRDIGFGFPLVFAFLIEIVSAFGPAGIVAYAEATRREAKAVPQEPQPQTVLSTFKTIEHRSLGKLIDYVTERTEPAPDASAIGARELHQDYEAWCLGRGFAAVGLPEFIDAFDEMRKEPELQKVRKFADRYYGIRTRGNAIGRLRGHKR